MWIFLGLFALSLGAEFIANDRPIMLSHDGRLFVPIFRTYAETDFGGELPIEANYKDPHIQRLIRANSGWMLWPIISPANLACNSNT